MAKYKVGDKVRVRSDLILGRRYLMEDKETGDSFIEPMDDLLGKVVTIKEIARKYRIEEMAYNWTDEMFEGLAPTKETKFNIYDTVKHAKYGLGTVIEINKLPSKTTNRKEIYLIEFDHWHEDFPNYDDTKIWFSNSNEITLVKAFHPN